MLTLAAAKKGEESPESAWICLEALMESLKPRPDSLGIKKSHG
jgi:hypothetical protein